MVSTYFERASFSNKPHQRPACCLVNTFDTTSQRQPSRRPTRDIEIKKVERRKRNKTKGKREREPTKRISSCFLVFSSSLFHFPTPFRIRSRVTETFSNKERSFFTHLHEQRRRRNERKENKNVTKQEHNTSRTNTTSFTIVLLQPTETKNTKRIGTEHEALPSPLLRDLGSFRERRNVTRTSKSNARSCARAHARACVKARRARFFFFFLLSPFEGRGFLGTGENLTRGSGSRVGSLFPDGRMDRTSFDRRMASFLFHVRSEKEVDFLERRKHV